VPTGTSKIFKNGINNTCLAKKAERLSENIRKINREITERKFYACNISVTISLL